MQSGVLFVPHDPTFDDLQRDAEIVWNAIQWAISIAWGIIRGIWNLIETGLRGLGTLFNWLNDNVVQPVWSGISGAISGAWVHSARL
jgi:hypothetical protein